MQHRMQPRNMWAYPVRFAHQVPATGSQAGGEELIWVNAVWIDEAAGTVRGEVQNEPRRAPVREGDIVTVRIDEIVDWLVLDENGRVQAGGFTLDMEGAEGHGEDWYGVGGQGSGAGASGAGP